MAAKKTSAGKRRSASRSSLADKKAWAVDVCQKLKRLYPQAKCALDYQNPLQLLVATILSAQCTDVRVNMVTPCLFDRYPTAKDLAGADLSDLESIIRSTGFFRNKAKNIKACAQRLVDEFGGKVPRTMEDLLSLAGVARKTANVVLGNAFGVPGFVVDTHVGRLSRRLGFTRQNDPVKVEREVMELLPAEDWTLMSHLLISHGRAICQSRKPACDKCSFEADCPKIGIGHPATKQ
jgi:endonuclease III